ncbi:Uncharacterised protein [Kluyvera cryocrescens]|uniref:Uncharacterized protein n=1 Tax=Kluyvera cryocrescens TaxID=580 RepID=A0A485BTY6_KLUCR|nr:Uncharacterised protein [Kluyvera cryocrescens]
MRISLPVGAIETVIIILGSGIHVDVFIALWIELFAIHSSPIASASGIG